MTPWCALCSGFACTFPSASCADTAGGAAGGGDATDAGTPRVDHAATTAEESAGASPPPPFASRQNALRSELMRALTTAPCHVLLIETAGTAILRQTVEAVGRLRPDITVVATGKATPAGSLLPALLSVEDSRCVHERGEQRGRVRSREKREESGKRNAPHRTRPPRRQSQDIDPVTPPHCYLHVG